ncbi:hypothetical protein [Hydrogenophilus islandicus]
MTSFLPYVTKLAEKTMALHLSLAWATMAFTRFWRALSPCGLTLQKLARFLLLSALLCGTSNPNAQTAWVSPPNLRFFSGRMTMRPFSFFRYRNRSTNFRKN